MPSSACKKKPQVLTAVFAIGAGMAAASGVLFGPLVGFNFEWYGDHRDLHSFPTRRSSDLQGRSRPCGLCSARHVPETFCLAQERERRCRSEEHTSELQSQFHLVCRLLL